MTDHNIAPLDYSAIQSHIRRARLEQSVILGEYIADGVIATWNGLKRAAGWISHQARQVGGPPCDYTTSMPRHF